MNGGSLMASPRAMMASGRCRSIRKGTALMKFALHFGNNTFSDPEGARRLVRLAEVLVYGELTQAGTASESCTFSLRWRRQCSSQGFCIRHFLKTRLAQSSPWLRSRSM